MFADEVKYFSLKHAGKKMLFNIFVTIGFILDHISGPMKDKLTCLVFVFRRDMSNGICDPVL